MTLTEIQIDRLVGPTHHFGGLGVGNLASMKHAGETSNPRAAALQGLDKMRLVASLGAVQMILPPQPRPRIDVLRSLGFQGDDADVLRRARDEAPQLLSAACSCSAMWTANAATVTPAVDRVGVQETQSSTGAIDVTIANLVSSVHRAIEPAQTCADLRLVLPESSRLHDPLPGGAALRDEGAANHMRLGSSDAAAGINLLVHGDGDPSPQRHWPRQTQAACQAIARLHGLPSENTFFLQQHPGAIDAGAFHNDVVAMSHHDCWIHHELAYLDADRTMQTVEHRFAQLYDRPLHRVVVRSEELSLEDSVATYLFNSQILSTDSSGPPLLICPAQVDQHAGAKRLVERLVPVGSVSRGKIRRPDAKHVGRRWSRLSTLAGSS